MVVGEMSELSMRERKKLATRVALSEAACRLMIESGFEAVSTEAIARAVDVSPRTVRNYFSSREEAILDGLLRRGVHLVAEVRARPAGEPVWESLTHVLPDLLAEFVGREDLLEFARAIRNTPALTAQHLLAYERTHHLLAEVIAERTGTTLERDLAPRLLAAAAILALRTACELKMEGVTVTALPDLVRESLALLREGLPLGAAPSD